MTRNRTTLLLAALIAVLILIFVFYRGDDPEEVPAQDSPAVTGQPAAPATEGQ